MDKGKFFLYQKHYFIFQTLVAGNKTKIQNLIDFFRILLKGDLLIGWDVK